MGFGGKSSTTMETPRILEPKKLQDTHVNSESVVNTWSIIIMKTINNAVVQKPQQSSKSEDQIYGTKN